MFSDSSSENSRHAMTTSGITRNTLPSVPGTNSSGLKAATVVFDGVLDER